MHDVITYSCANWSIFDPKSNPCRDLTTAVTNWSLPHFNNRALVRYRPYIKSITYHSMQKTNVNRSKNVKRCTHRCVDCVNLFTIWPRYMLQAVQNAEDNPYQTQQIGTRQLWRPSHRLFSTAIVAESTFQWCHWSRLFCVDFGVVQGLCDWSMSYCKIKHEIKDPHFH